MDLDPVIAGVKLLYSAENIIKKRHHLLQILDDGKITPDEVPILNELCADYKALRLATLALELEKEKHRANGVC